MTTSQEGYLCTCLPIALLCLHVAKLSLQKSYGSHAGKQPDTLVQSLPVCDLLCSRILGDTSNRHITDMLAFLFLPSVTFAKARLSFHSKEKDHDQEKTAPHRMPLAPQLYEKMCRLWARPGGRCLYARRSFCEQHGHVRCVQLWQGKIR